MDKGLWLELFEDAIKKLPKAERNKVVMFYREMIEDKIEGGKSEDSVIAELGNPNDVAQKILNENGIQCEDKDFVKASGQVVKSLEPKKGGIPIWLACLSGIVVVPVGIALGATWVAMIVSFWAVFVSLVVASLACCIAIFAGIVMAFCGVVGSGYALVGGAIAGTGVTMLLAVGFYWLCIYMSKATAWFFRKKEKRGEQDERD